MSKGWWYRASTEQRLAQIDAGIELGMTAAQVAMNCGAAFYSDGKSHVHVFARDHGRKFRNSQEERALQIEQRKEVERLRRLRSRPVAKSQLRNAYLSGEVVDFWSAR